VVLAFFRGRGSTGEGWPGGNGGVNVFNTMEDGEVKGRVKGRVKEGFLIAGRVKARGRHSRHELGGAGWSGALGFGSGTAGVGRHGVGDRADSQGPLDRER
jgi:hypothetical protein